MNNIKKEIFDRQVSILSKKGGDGKLLNRHKKVLNLIFENCNRNDYILDVGCFDGKILKTLEQKGYKNLYGVDFSETSKKSFKNTSIHFATYDIERDKIPYNRKFNAVIYTDVLEHVLSPQTILFDIKKNLSEDGKIFFSVPNAGWILNGLLLSFLPSKLFLSSAFGPWGHTYHFTFYQIRKIANNLGFTINNLSGGRMSNYIFKKGLKKILYDLFLFCVSLLALFWPQVFSDHIFGVFRNTPKKLKMGARLELEN